MRCSSLIDWEAEEAAIPRTVTINVGVPDFDKMQAAIKYAARQALLEREAE